MQTVIDAALEVQDWLITQNAKFCIIGGLAVQRWGEPRMTKDADLTLFTGFIEDEKWVDLLLGRFPSRRNGAKEFALASRVLLLQTSEGVPIDLALGALDFEINCIDRSSDWELADGRFLQTCSAEDLVVHKAFASRDRDWADVDGILMRQGTRLNVELVFEELTPLVALKEEPEILSRLRSMMVKRGVATF